MQEAQERLFLALKILFRFYSICCELFRVFGLFIFLFRPVNSIRVKLLCAGVWKRVKMLAHFDTRQICGVDIRVKVKVWTWARRDDVIQGCSDGSLVRYIVTLIIGGAAKRVSVDLAGRAAKRGFGGCLRGCFRAARDYLTILWLW